MLTDSRAAVIKDVRDTRALLRRFAPEVLKELDKANRAAAKPLVNKAKSYVPSDSDQLENWSKYGRYRWESNKVKSGIKFKSDRRQRGRRYNALLTFMNIDVAGSIYELAGYQDPGTQFNRQLTGRFGRAPRIIWRAVDREALVKLRSEILQNYKDAEAALNHELAKRRAGNK